jgi:hypothetical protein
MCGRVIQSSAPIRYAIVDGMNVRDSRVHNYPPRWNGAPRDLLVIRRNHETGEVSLDPLRQDLIPYWCQLNATHGVEMRPPLVATIHRAPHRTMESTRPTPGTVSPRFAVQIPFGPSRTALPLVTSRSIHPSMVFNLVSGTGMRFT